MQQLDSLLPERVPDAQHPTTGRHDQVATESLAPANTLLEHAPDSGTDEQPICDPVAARVDTHWTRILYCDVFAAHSDGSTPDLSEHAKGALQLPPSDCGTCPRRGNDPSTFAATEDSSCSASSGSIGSPRQAARVLAAIAIAILLAVVNVLVSTEADAVAPDSSLIFVASHAKARPPTTTPGVHSCPK